MPKVKPLLPIVVIGTLMVSSGVLLGSAGYQVYQNQQTLQQNPSEENQRRSDASLEVLKTTVSAIGTLATIAGGVVLYLNFRVATRNAEIANRNAQIAADNLKVSEEKQVTERFAKAIEHLGNQDVHIRLGGIYALERIAKDSPRDHWTIMEILSAYVRERSPVKPSKSPEAAPKKSLVESYLQETTISQSTDNEVDKVAVDIQAALTVIGRRREWQDPDGARIDLRTTNLVGADFSWASLKRADLYGVNLNKANLSNADLSRANLSNASFKGTNLAGIRGWTDEQLSYAKLCLTILPKGSKLDPDRDCKRFGITHSSSEATNPTTPINPDVITSEGKEGEVGEQEKVIEEWDDLGNLWS